MSHDDTVRPLSAIKREAIALFDSLPPECQRPALRMLMRIRNDYPTAKAQALYRQEVTADRSRGK